MNSEKLESLIAKEEKNLASYRAKIEEYERKVEASENKLKEYKMMQNSQRFDILADIVQQNGLSVDALIDAIKNGNLLDLQEQMEEAQKASETDAMEELDENSFGV